MKKLVFAILSMVAINQAEARSLKPSIEAKLDQFVLQPKSYLAKNKKNIGEAKVVINLLGEQSINLRIDFTSNCPKNAVCAAVMPEPFEVSVPLNKVSTGGCGETIYTGAIDRRPVDGNRQELKVIDNRSNYCEYFFAIPMTKVVYKVEGLRPQFKESHVLNGEQLH